jgi:Flp pilus assembly protein TadG
VLARCIALLKALRRDERGSALVEMTLITPLMISLSAGVFEFGNLIEKKLLIEAGLRDAARYAARCKQSFSGVDCATVAAGIAATGGTGTARVSGWSSGDVTVDLDYVITPVTIDADGNQNYRSTDDNVYTVRVSTSFTYTGTSLLAYLGISPITLTGAHEERYIGW